jgi:hypothetical protein
MSIDESINKIGVREKPATLSSIIEKESFSRSKEKNGSRLSASK